MSPLSTPHGATRKKRLQPRRTYHDKIKVPVRRWRTSRGVRPIPGPRARYRTDDSAVTIDAAATPAPRPTRSIDSGPADAARAVRSATPLDGPGRPGDLPGVTRRPRATRTAEVAPAFPDLRRSGLNARRTAARKRETAHIACGAERSSAELNMSKIVICLTICVTGCCTGRCSVWTSPGAQPASTTLTCSSSRVRYTIKDQEVTPGHRPPA